MSRVRANKLVDKAGTGAPQLSFGAEVPVGYGITGAGSINITGVTTSSGFVGPLTGAVTGNVTGNCSGSAGSATGNAGGLTGTPSITVANVTAVDGSFSGNVSIAKTLTYEDVKNVDSVGLITARSGLLVGPSTGIGATINTNGNASFAGVVTATTLNGTHTGDGSGLSGVISGVEVKSSGTSAGTGLTALNFSGATVVGDTTAGIATITIASAGIETAAHVKTNGQTAILNLGTAQDHKVTATGTVTITTTGGSEGDSHDIRIINNGTATVGFSTNFLWPSGAVPSLPTVDKAVSLISFTVNKVGVGTQLLSGASLNYS